MGAVALLLDNYKKATSTRSDNALSEQFDVTRQTVSQWRNGSAYPGEDTIVALAEGAKQDSGGWLAAIRAERCTGPAALAYRKIARSLGIAAAVCLAFYTSIGSAVEATPRFDNSNDVVGIAHLKRVVARILYVIQSMFATGGARHGTAALC